MSDSNTKFKNSQSAVGNMTSRRPAKKRSAIGKEPDSHTSGSHKSFNIRSVSQPTRKATRKRNNPGIASEMQKTLSIDSSLYFLHPFNFNEICRKFEMQQLKAEANKNEKSRTSLKHHKTKSTLNLSVKGQNNPQKRADTSKQNNKTPSSTNSPPRPELDETDRHSKPPQVEETAIANPNVKPKPQNPQEGMHSDQIQGQSSPQPARKKQMTESSQTPIIISPEIYMPVPKKKSSPGTLYLSSMEYLHCENGSCIFGVRSPPKVMVNKEDETYLSRSTLASPFPKIQEI